MIRLQYLAVGVIVAGCTLLTACGNTGSPATIDSSDPVVQAGERVAREQGCLACHSTSGKRLSGPTFKGLAGSQVELTNGSTVTVDDAYLRRAIDDPDAEIREGYPKNIMRNVLSTKEPLSSQQVDELVAYIKAVPR